jgi:hypothetical protein
VIIFPLKFCIDSRGLDNGDHSDEPKRINQPSEGVSRFPLNSIDKVFL